MLLFAIFALRGTPWRAQARLPHIFEIFALRGTPWCAQAGASTNVRKTEIQPTMMLQNPKLRESQTTTKNLQKPRKHKQTKRSDSGLFALISNFIWLHARLPHIFQIFALRGHAMVCTSRASTNVRKTEQPTMMLQNPKLRESQTTTKNLQKPRKHKQTERSDSRLFARVSNLIWLHAFVYNLRPPWHAVAGTSKASTHL